MSQNNSINANNTSTNSATSATNTTTAATTTNNSNFVRLHTTRAHVFQIDSETLNSWQALHNQAIPVSILASINSNPDALPGEPGERELKIVGAREDGQTLMDAGLTASTVFHQVSQKFGQIFDRKGKLYGFGFDTEGALTEFIELFKRWQKDILIEPIGKNKSASNNNSSANTSPQQQHQQQQTQAQAQAQLHQHQQPQQQPRHSTKSPSNSQQPQPQPHAQQQSMYKAGWTQQQQPQQQQPQQHQLHHQHPSETNGRQLAASRQSATGPSLHQYSHSLANAGHQQAQARRQAGGLPAPGGPLNGDSTSEHHELRAGSARLHQPKLSTSSSIVAGGAAVSSSNNNNAAGKSTPDADAALRSVEWQQVEQIRYENERLKQALEENSKNALIWDTELHNLRTNNSKLTYALQESKANVAAWQRQMNDMKRENTELKLRMTVLESAGAGDHRNMDYSQALQKYKDYVEEIQSELRNKDDEIDLLQRSMGELELKASASFVNGDGGPPAANSAASTATPTASSALGAKVALQVDKFESINAKLAAKLAELSGLQRELTQTLDKLHQHEH